MLKEGLLMASLTSPVLANTFMEILENKILNLNSLNNVSFWYRYVDDTLACLFDSDRELDEFFRFSNSLHTIISN